MNRLAVAAERRAANLAQNYGRAINLSAGCAVLPLPVLKQAQKNFLDTRDLGLSVTEMGYRTRNFHVEMEEAEASFRKLLNIPTETHEVHFFNGGATLQFAAIPMNLLGRAVKHDGGKSQKLACNYIMNGHWSEKSRNEAKLFQELLPNLEVNEVTDCPLQKNLFFSLSNDYERDWKFLKTTTQDEEINKKTPTSSRKAVYTHYTAADTRQGFEFHDFPYEIVPKDQILACDASANLGSKPIDVSKYGVLYAAAHKNFSTSGVCYTIIRKALLEENAVLPGTPTMCNWWKFQTADNKIYNVPVIFAIWLGKLTTNWMLEQGGLQFFDELAKTRANVLYNFIDNECEQFYSTFVTDPKFRSRMNIVFTIGDGQTGRNPELVAKFLQETSEDLGWLDIRSHPLGIDSDAIRVTTYNAQTLETVQIVRDFMQDFWKRHR
ncbi:unnamed protein product [Amoebophrya sp. A120]|nr:unnamed protein product [Amoebophrya sp. A120]|eukprot:GSA120T00009314001.1